MKLKKPAKRLASAGRNGDSMLMHVSPNEVEALSGIAALVGRKLTKNPHTGLTEAFSLTDVASMALPIVAGIYGGPAGAAAASAALQYKKTGNLNQALMAGAASGAMGSMLSGAAGAGGDAASQAVTQGATDATTQAATDAVTQGAVQNGAGSAAINGSLDSAAIPGVLDYSGVVGSTQPTAGLSSLSGAGGSMDAAAAPGTMNYSEPGLSSLSAQPAQAAPSTWSQKIDNLKNAKWTGKDSVMQNADGSLKMAPIIAGGSLMGLAGMSSDEDAMKAYEKQQAQDKESSDKRFRYYQSMAGKMPANMIPAYPG